MLWRLSLCVLLGNLLSAAAFWLLDASFEQRVSEGLHRYGCGLRFVGLRLGAEQWALRELHLRCAAGELRFREPRLAFRWPVRSGSLYPVQLTARSAVGRAFKPPVRASLEQRSGGIGATSMAGHERWRRLEAFALSVSASRAAVQIGDALLLGDRLNAKIVAASYRIKLGRLRVRGESGDQLALEGVELVGRAKAWPAQQRSKKKSHLHGLVDRLESTFRRVGVSSIEAKETDVADGLTVGPWRIAYPWRKCGRSSELLDRGEWCLERTPRLKLGVRALGVSLPGMQDAALKVDAVGTLQGESALSVDGRVAGFATLMSWFAKRYAFERSELQTLLERVPEELSLEGTVGDWRHPERSGYLRASIRAAKVLGLTASWNAREAEGEGTELEVYADPRLDCLSVLELLPEQWLGLARQLSWRGAIDLQLALGLKAEDRRVALRKLSWCEPVAHTAPLRLLPNYYARAYRHRPQQQVYAQDSFRLGPGSGNYWPLDDMSSALVAAVLAHEDAGFFRHRGVSLNALEQALMRNMRAGEVQVGASTLTMQLAKNLFLPFERRLSRKLEELFLARWLEFAWSKSQMLDTYLNVIEYGFHVLGIQAASQHYFERPARELSWAQAALLAQMLPAPRRREAALLARPLPPGLARSTARFLVQLVQRGFMPPEALEAALDELHGAPPSKVLPPAFRDALALRCRLGVPGADCAALSTTAGSAEHAISPDVAGPALPSDKPSQPAGREAVTTTR